MAEQSQHHDDKDEVQHHIVPIQLLAKVCGTLLVLTAMTVIAARLHLGAFEAPVAFLIATAKALLVMAIFMGLKYEERSNRIIFGAGFFFLAVLIFFCALDIWTRVAETSTL